MADYQVIVQFPSLSLVGMTGAQIVAAINASEAVINSENVEGGSGGSTVSMTGNQIVDAINNEATSEHKIYAGHIRDLVKTMVSHGEKALNLIYTGDPRKTSFQTEFATSILANDYVQVAEVNQSEIFSNGDWLIARIANPGFVFSDTSKWEVKKFASNSVIPVFRQHSSAAENQSGIESIPGGSQAIGNHSFAPGYQTVATGESASALGKQSRSTRTGEVSESSGMFTEAGDLQRSRDIMRLVTTNAVPTEMALPFKFGFEANKTYVLKIQLMARVGSGTYAKGVQNKEWEYKFFAAVDENGYVYNDGGLVSSSNLSNPSINVSVTVVPDNDIATPPLPTVFKGLKIQCTGLNGVTVRWAAFIESFELKY